MKATIFSLLTMAVVAAADASADDHKEIQGAWGIVSAKDADPKNPMPPPKKAKVVFAGNKMTITGLKADTTNEAEFRLDPSKKPKQIDLFLAGKEGRPNLGIYELAGDRLKIAVGEAGGSRATEFEPLQKSPQGYLVLMVLKREKR